MSAVSSLFGKSEAQRWAERQREKAEDALMAVHPMERADLSVHCDAEAERGLVFLTRLREIQAVSTAVANRNLLATIIVGALILTLNGVSFREAIHALVGFLNAF